MVGNFNRFTFFSQYVFGAGFWNVAGCLKGYPKENAGLAFFTYSYLGSWQPGPG